MAKRQFALLLVSAVLACPDLFGACPDLFVLAAIVFRSASLFPFIEHSVTILQLFLSSCC
jgi:hypothetical protein